MHRLRAVSKVQDIPDCYLETPIGKLLEYHNLGKSHEECSVNAKLLVGMCMDSRKQLRIPENFAFILRAGGGNLRSSEFKVSYAIAVGGVRFIALIGHTQCGMVGLDGKKDLFIGGLMEGAGWSAERAEKHFQEFAPFFEIGHEIDFVASEAERLRRHYPKILIAPMIYKVEDGMLYLVADSATSA